MSNAKSGSEPIPLVMVPPGRRVKLVRVARPAGRCADPRHDRPSQGRRGLFRRRGRCHHREARSGNLSRRLAELGLTPGVEFDVLQDGGGPVLIAVRDSRLALGRSAASRILVEYDEGES